jgi:hypothetical protein
LVINTGDIVILIIGALPRIMCKDIATYESAILNVGIVIASVVALHHDMTIYGAQYVAVFVTYLPELYGSSRRLLHCDYPRVGWYCIELSPIQYRHQGEY